MIIYNLNIQNESTSTHISLVFFFINKINFLINLFNLLRNNINIDLVLYSEKFREIFCR